MRICTRCLTAKPETAFRRGQGYKGGIRTECKDCERERLQAWRVANPERVREQTARSNASKRRNGTGDYSGDPLVAMQRRDRYLRRTYGITLEQEQALRVGQGGGCAACGEKAILHVDHCHRQGSVRGLLCDDCNRSAGAVGDDPARLRALADYLENPPAPAILHQLPEESHR